MEQTTSPAITIEQLYHEYHQPLLRYLHGLVRNRETAEDLCHETFIKALRHWSDIEQAAVARSWLFRIATNTAYDYLRRQGRVAITPLTDDDDAACEGSPALETRFADGEPVWAALRHLPDHYRVPLLLQVEAGYPLHDVAVMLGCNPNTIKTRVHRARERFREIYIA